MIPIKEALSFGFQSLKTNSSTAKLDAELLLSFLLKKDRVFFYAHGESVLTPHEFKSFKELITKRQSGLPIAYLIGRREFWSLGLKITPGVLIPRPETELLVTVSLAQLGEKKILKVLDLGTGSGAIVLALAHERPLWQYTAIDINPKALELAAHNAKDLDLHCIHFYPGSWFEGIKPLEKFDLIISNPPYLARTDPHLSQGDLRFEPPEALISGETGLEALETIVASARPYLNASGLLLLEHGAEQAAAVRNVFIQSGFEPIETVQDLQGHDRVSGGTMR